MKRLPGGFDPRFGGRRAASTAFPHDPDRLRLVDVNKKYGGGGDPRLPAHQKLKPAPRPALTNGTVKTAPAVARESPKPTPATAEANSFRERREAKKAETAALKARKAKDEDEAFRKLKDREPKVMARKVCEKLCKDDFGIGPQGAKRIWNRLRPKLRKSASKRPIGKA